MEPICVTTCLTLGVAAGGILEDLKDEFRDEIRGHCTFLVDYHLGAGGDAGWMGDNLVLTDARRRDIPFICREEARGEQGETGQYVSSRLNEA
jgi:hypothetical protein